MSEPFIGQISMFAGNFAPRSWAFCDGQTLLISNNTALFSLLGTTFGGDGQTTFGLPDLRGRVPVHSGNSQGPGLSNRPLGSRSGNENTALAVNNLPPHSHTFACNNGDGNADEPGGRFPSKGGNGESIYNDSAGTGTGNTMNAAAISSVGGGAAFTNMPPFLAINFIIALTGTFPSPN